MCIPSLAAVCGQWMPQPDLSPLAWPAWARPLILGAEPWPPTGSEAGAGSNPRWVWACRLPGSALTKMDVGDAARPAGLDARLNRAAGRRPGAARALDAAGWVPNPSLDSIRRGFAALLIRVNHYQAWRVLGWQHSACWARNMPGEVCVCASWG